jgi:hypothetical protein
MQEWSTSSFGMDIHIAYKLEGLLEGAGFVNVQKIQFNHGYGALAHSSTQKDASAELYVECFRSIDAKMPPGRCFGGSKIPSAEVSPAIRPTAFCTRQKKMQVLADVFSIDGIPGVAKTPQEFHDFLDRLEVEIKKYGFQPKLNFVFAQKGSN